MKIMRLRHAKVVIAVVVIANIILFYYSWKSTFWKNITSSLTATSNDLNIADTQQIQMQLAKSSKDKSKNANKHIRKSITIVFRTFYTFENDLKATIDSILSVIPNMQILVLQEGVPYPPISYERNSSSYSEENSVRFLNLGFDIQKTPDELNTLAAIRTKYALFMPDSVRITSKNLLQKILREINSHALKTPAVGNTKLKLSSALVPIYETVRHVVIVPFVGNIKSFSSCTEIKLDLPNWTIHYLAVNNSEKCDLYLQKHAILIDTGILKELPDPFATPFPEMLYIQMKIAEIPRTIFPQAFQEGRRLFTSYHTKQRRMEARRRQFKEMYKKLQIKRIVRSSHKVVPKTETKDTGTNIPQHNLVLDTQFSSSNFSLPQVIETDLIGCERVTRSCIGPVYNNKPYYIYIGRHTPPCCLDKLKTTFNHVFEEFENVGIRYWLDNHALKSAIDTNQLSPDAYEIDVSFNINDLERSNSLKKSQNKPYVDNEGFYWIKATDGHYFRVQFSKINQIGINLLPFEIKGNVMHPSGFFGWKAKEFAVDYLHPMSNVLFLGKNIMCPNNVREFLEYKNIKN